MLTENQRKQISLEVHRGFPLIGHGDHQGRRYGDGEERASLREYEPEDDSRLIDWHATASSDPFTYLVRPRIEERDFHATVVLDLSARILYGGIDAVISKDEVLRDTAEVFVEVLERQGDSYGLLTLDGSLNRKPPMAGSEHKPQLLGMIRNTPGGGDDMLGKGLALLDTVQYRTEMVVVCSDFLASGWEVPLQRLSRYRTVYAVQVLDATDSRLPDETFRFIHPDSGRTVPLGQSRKDKKYRASWNENAKSRLEAIDRRLRAAGVIPIKLQTGSGWFEEQLNQLKRLRFSNRAA
jgi:uncharacterized protein (DUF58 family)